MAVAHISLSSVNRMPLFPTEGARRRAIHALARVVGGIAALFCIVDDHVHVVGAGDVFPGMVARGLHASLAVRAQAPVNRPHVKPVEDRSHLMNLVRYLLLQTDHHELDAHPATWSGSAFQDLVGARMVPGMKAPLWRLLPRLRRSDLFEIVGLNPDLAPLENDRVRSLGAWRITSAAASAHAAPPNLKGNSPASVAARRAAVHLASASGLSVDEMVWALAMTKAGVRRLRRRPVDAAALRATRLRLALEEMVVGQALRKTG